MQTYQIELNDKIADKVLWFLENLKENITIKEIENISSKSDLEQSIDNLKNNEITSIDDIDSYIKVLENEIK